jgi:hypothetical protein
MQHATSSLLNILLAFPKEFSGFALCMHSQELGRAIHMAFFTWSPNAVLSKDCDEDVTNYCLAARPNMASRPGAVGSCLANIVRVCTWFGGVSVVIMMGAGTHMDGAGTCTTDLIVGVHASMHSCWVTCMPFCL